jgi:hypothetical protein
MPYSYVLGNMGKTVKTTFFIVLVAIISIGIGFTVLGVASMRYSVLQFQGPYRYEVTFGEGTQAEDLGVAVNLNLSHFDGTWFVGEEENFILEVSAEKGSSMVQNFSWRIFWIELFTLREGRWHIVGHGSVFLNETEWSDLRLHRRQDVSVGIVNLNYLESVDKAWFRIGIMMNVYHNNTDYGLTFYTPMGEIGPVSILSPLYSPVSLAMISTATTALSITLARQLLGKTTLISKKSPSTIGKENL